MYLDIPKELNDDFSYEMKKFKTYMDDVVMDYVRNILDKKYYLNPKGEFKSERDMCDQFTDTKTYDDDTRKGIIKKIPCSFVRYVLKKVYNEDRSNPYIANGLGDSWAQKSIRYGDNNSPCKGLVRKDDGTDSFSDIDE